MTIFSLKKNLVEIDDTLGHLMMTLSFNTLKVTIFSNLLPIFFKQPSDLPKALSRKLSESLQFLSGSNDSLSKPKFR
jgi:hypothetical protein